MDRPIHSRSNAEPSLANWCVTDARAPSATDARSRALLLLLLLNDGIGGPAIARQALAEHRVLPSPCGSTTPAHAHRSPCPVSPHDNELQRGGLGTTDYAAQVNTRRDPLHLNGQGVWSGRLELAEIRRADSPAQQVVNGD